ncbi:30451_t:CDS:2, partial [Racocetra persica]
FLDNGQYLVLCAQIEQSEFLSQSLYIEIDMSFKRIHGATNEWEICAYIYHYQKAYQYLFEDLFDIVKKDMQKPFEFQHIHARELGYIIADKHQGQVL